MKKIYIIEDSLTVQKQILSFLKNIKAELTCFSNATSALEKIRIEKPDLLILDLNLPDFNGDKFMIKLSEEVLIYGIECILITAQKLDKNELFKFSTLGISHCLNKPLDKTILIKLVENYIENN